MKNKLKPGLHNWTNVFGHSYNYLRYEQGGLIRFEGTPRSPFRTSCSDTGRFKLIAPIKLMVWNDDNTVVPK